jgi:hypothetical protein
MNGICLAKAPLTLSLSHPLADADTLECQLAKASWRGEGVPSQPLRRRPLSPWGEGQGEGVFA